MLGLNLGLSILALVLVVLGLLCLWWRKSTQREMQLMASTPLSTATQAAQAAPGTVVKVAGTLRCQAPIAAEFSNTPCAYYKAEITREEVYYDRDSDGKERRNTRTLTVYSNSNNAACAVADASGMVGVDFKGATVEAMSSLDRYGAPYSGGGVMGVLSAIGSSGDRYKESILAVDCPIYVLGEIHQGGLIGAPVKGSHNKTFVISHRSEEERVKDLGWTAKLAFGLMLAFFAGTIASLVWA
jgi:hypothetical protein